MKEVVLKQTRGGQGLFQWESIKTDRYKSCYLGSSVKANGGGRYAISYCSLVDGQTTRWYKKTGGKDSNVDGELDEIKRLEAEAFAEALGYSGPKRLTMATQQVSKQELTRAITKEARAEERAERLQGSSGIGFNPDDPTKKEDVRDIIEAHMIGKLSDRPVSLLTGRNPGPSAVNHPAPIPEEESTSRKKEKREKKHKKHKRSSHSDSESEERKRRRRERDDRDDRRYDDRKDSRKSHDKYYDSRRSEDRKYESRRSEDRNEGRRNGDRY